MNRTLERVKSWAEQAPKAISRWPGAAVRLSNGTKSDQIDFRKGVVIQVTDLSIAVEMDHPVFKLVKLLGDSYAHYCPECRRTIPGNVTYRRSAGTAENSAGEQVPIRFFCPYCGPDHLLRMLEPGDRLRLHYRFDKAGEWAGWYGEVWEW